MSEYASWLWLLLGIVLEISGTTSMKLAAGFTRLLPSLAVFAFYGLSLIMVTLALRGLQISVAYAVWCAVGIAGIALIGYVAFGEPMTPLRLASFGLIILGVVGLNLSGAGERAGAGARGVPERAGGSVQVANGSLSGEHVGVYGEHGGVQSLGTPGVVPSLGAQAGGVPVQGGLGQPVPAVVSQPGYGRIGYGASGTRLVTVSGPGVIRTGSRSQPSGNVQSQPSSGADSQASGGGSGDSDSQASGGGSNDSDSESGSDDRGLGGGDSDRDSGGGARQRGSGRSHRDSGPGDGDQRR